METRYQRLVRKSRKYGCLCRACSIKEGKWEEPEFEAIPLTPDGKAADPEQPIPENLLQPDCDGDNLDPRTHPFIFSWEGWLEFKNLEGVENRKTGLVDHFIREDGAKVYPVGIRIYKDGAAEIAFELRTEPPTDTGES